MNQYKINIHAHSIFSDGINSPLGMALEAKRLGFTSLVITDHFYGPNFPEISMNLEKYKLLKKACREAKKILPVIIGLECSFMGQEILVFGSAAVKAILGINGTITGEMLGEMRQETGCACILCHPDDDTYWPFIREYIDGFEHYNSGCDRFKDRPFGPLEGLQRWCNSDAHQDECLGKAYNIIGSKITTEQDLIKYIKKGQQPEFAIYEV